MNEYLKIAIVILYSYLICNIHPAYIIGKLHAHEDIRESGSNNSGASNTTIKYGYKFGILVAVVDICKGLLVVSLTKMYFPDYTILSVLFAILGHMFPFWMGFRGGKGFATLVGCIGGLNFPLAWILGACIIIITFVTQYIVVATMFACIFYSCYVYYLYGFSINFLLALPVTLLIIYKHRVNLVRIAKGEEFKLKDSFKKKEK